MIPDYSGRKRWAQSPLLLFAVLLLIGCAGGIRPSPEATAEQHPLDVPSSTRSPAPTLTSTAATSVPTATATREPSATATPPPTATPIPPLTWELLKNTTYLLPVEMGGPPDGQVILEDGVFSWTPVPGSASVERYILYKGVAFGDINGDTVADALTIIVNVSAGSGNFYWLFGVLNDGGDSRSLLPLFIGDRVVLQSLRAVDGEVQLRFWTYRSGEPFGSTPTLLVERGYRLEDGELVLQTETQLNADAVVNTTEVREIVPLVLPDDGGAVGISNRVATFGLDEYRLDLVAGQELSISVSSAHQDVFLSAFGLETSDVLVPIDEESAFWQGTIAHTQLYALNVFAIGSDAEYVLTVQASAPPPAPTPEATAPAVPVAGSSGAVYLTFDDGPIPPYSPQILDLLDQHEAQATFFVLGSNGDKHRDLLELAREGGHTLANHTWNHRSLAGLSQEDFNKEVLDTAELLGEGAALCLRPPFGATDAFTRAYAAELGYEIIMWNIDTLDWSRPGNDAIVAAVSDSIYSGAIVLMHDGGGDRTQTVAALETVLTELAALGYEFAPLCQ